MKSSVQTWTFLRVLYTVEELTKYEHVVKKVKILDSKTAVEIKKTCWAKEID